jgi:hypothetical protein
MRCDEFHAYAAGWLEGERQPEAAGHFETCTRCSARIADLELIVATAASLPELDPPDRVWTSLRNDLAREGLLRERKSVLERIREMLPAAPQTALATGLISALAALLLFLPGEPVGVGRNGTGAPGIWNFAEMHHQLASAEAQAGQDVHFRDPQVAASYQQNLALVDNLIGECQKRVNEDPNDELSRQYLVAAYQQKADLLNALSEREALGD